MPVVRCIPSSDRRTGRKLPDGGRGKTHLAAARNLAPTEAILQVETARLLVDDVSASQCAAFRNWLRMRRFPDSRSGGPCNLLEPRR